jgi:adenylyl- and sulfurtransferase ThiI
LQILKSSDVFREQLDDLKIKEANAALIRILKNNRAVKAEIAKQVEEWSNGNRKKKSVILVEPDLKAEIKNIIRHIFGHHGSCNVATCRKTQIPCSEKQYDNLQEVANKLAKQVASIAENHNTNSCEGFVSRYSMFLNGRRVNFSRSDDAVRRAYLTGLNTCCGM